MSFTDNYNWLENDENQGIPEVYGWIELGGATSEQSMLKHTSSIDILVRTIHQDSMIVLGNSKHEHMSQDNQMENAGLYIKNNNLGVSKLPSENINIHLSIHGDSETDGIFSWKTTDEVRLNSQTSNVEYEIDIDSSNMQFKSRLIGDFNQNQPMNLISKNLELTSLGLVKNKLVISDSVQIDVNDLEKNVYIREFTPNDFRNVVNVGYNLQTEYNSSLIDKFIKDNVFIIGETQFIVMNDPKILGTARDDFRSISMDIKPVFPEKNFEPLPLQRDMHVDIRFLKALRPPEPSELSNIIQSELISRITNVFSYELSHDKKSMTLRLTLAVFENELDPFEGQYVSQREEFFNEGFFYYFQNNQMDFGQKQFLDKIVKCTRAKPIIQPGNIKRMELTFTGVDDVPIDIYFRTLMEGFDVVNAEENQLFFYLLDIPFTFGFDKPEPILLSFDKGENVQSSSTVKYTIRHQNNAFLFNYLLNEQYRLDYINDALYIMEPSEAMTAIWTIESFEPIDLKSGIITLRTFDYEIDFNKAINLNQERNANVLLFRLKIMNRIGNFFHDAFIPFGTRLGIATTNCPEVLTVNGTASVRDHFVMYNQNSPRPFHLSFTNQNARIHLQDDLRNPLSKEVNDDPLLFPRQRFIDFHVGSSSSIDDVFVNADTRFLRKTIFSEDNNKDIKPVSYFQLDGKAISAFTHEHENLSVNLFGKMDIPLMVAQDYQTNVFQIKDIEVIDVFFHETFFDMMQNQIVDGVLLKVDVMFKNKILPYDLIKIKDTLFRVLKINIPVQDPDLRYVYLYMEWYFDQERLTIGSNNNILVRKERIDIQLYRGIQETNKARAFIYFELDDFEFEKDSLGKHVYLTLSGTIPSMEKMFLAVGRFFCIKTSCERPGVQHDDLIPHVLILKAMSQIRGDEFILEFRSVDNITDLKDETDLGDILDFKKLRNQHPSVFIYPLNSFFHPNRRQFPYDKYRLSKFPYEKRFEKDVNISYSAEKDDRMFINIENASELPKFISPTSQFLINPIDRVYTDRGVYDIAGVYQFDRYIKFWAKFVNTNYMKSVNNVSISYAFNGIPMKVQRVEYPGDDISIIFYLKDVDMATYELLKLYLGHSVFIMDKYNIIWSLANLIKTVIEKEDITIMTVTNFSQNAKKLDVKDRIELSLERYIFIVPLQYFSYNRIADDKSRYENFAPQRLGIGTQFIRETLTVEGTMSCKDEMVLYNDNSHTPFIISYDNDSINFNDRLKISSSNLEIQADINIDGVFSASGYLTNSDRRLKENIVKCDPLEDLKTIKKLDVYSFNFKSDLKNIKDSTYKKGGIIQKQKGVIAQEVEKVLPDIVLNKNGILPNIQRKGKVILDETGEQHILIEGSNIVETKTSDHDDMNVSDLFSVFQILKEKDGVVVSLSYASTKQIKTKEKQKRQDKKIKIKNVFHEYCPVKKRFFLRIYVYENLDLYSRVFILGTLDHHKVVDYNYLFMTNLSALQALSEDVEKIKKYIGI